MKLGSARAEEKSSEGGGSQLQPVQDRGDIPESLVCGRVTEIPELNTEKKEFLWILGEIWLMFRLKD